MTDPVTVREAAALIGVPKGTVSGWIDANLLACVLVDGRRWVTVAAVRACYAERLAQPNRQPAKRRKASGRVTRATANDQCPARQARIRAYRERAARGLPLFDDCTQETTT